MSLIAKMSEEVADIPEQKDSRRVKMYFQTSEI